MARLAQYLSELASIMGRKESVHFISTAPGSACAIVYLDEEEDFE